MKDDHNRDDFAAFVAGMDQYKMGFPQLAQIIRIEYLAMIDQGFTPQEAMHWVTERYKGT